MILFLLFAIVKAETLHSIVTLESATCQNEINGDLEIWVNGATQATEITSMLTSNLKLNTVNANEKITTKELETTGLSNFDGTVTFNKPITFENFADIEIKSKLSTSEIENSNLITTKDLQLTGDLTSTTGTTYLGKVELSDVLTITGGSASTNFINIYPLGAEGIPATATSKNTGFSIDATNSIRTKQYVIAEGVLQSSDKRIKSDIAPLENALEKVLEVPVSTYRIKTLSRDKISGFVAQEVAKTLPDLVKKTHRSVPSIMQSIKPSFKDGKMFTSLGIKKGIVVDFKMHSLSKGNIEYMLEAKEDDVFDCSRCHDDIDSVFAYGAVVNDFHTIDLNQMYAYHHRAIQQLHEIIQKQTAKIEMLEQKL